MSHCFPKHCTNITVHFYRDRQDYTGLLHFSGRGYVLSTLRHALRP